MSETGARQLRLTVQSAHVWGTHSPIVESVELVPKSTMRSR